jgi:hypothetical protein
MRASLVIADDFYKNPDEVREYALNQRYYYPYQADDDVQRGRVRFSWMTSWFRQASECPFKSSTALIDRLELLTGDQIDMDHWKMDFPIDDEGKAAANCGEVAKSCLWNCCFHFKPDNRQELGEGVHNHVTDRWNEVGPDGWAGLIYLSRNAPLSGGLKLWRNRNPQRVYDWMTPKENWDMVDDIGNVYNRLILCRGNVPHSGAAGWGTKLENGRLYQTFFFKVKNFTTPASLQMGF